VVIVVYYGRARQGCVILESSNRSSWSSFQKELGNFLSCEELRLLVGVTLENAGSVGLAASGGQNGQNMLNYGTKGIQGILKIWESIGLKCDLWLFYR